METNNIYCGNALNLLKEMDNNPNLIIMSPPDVAETDYTLEEYREFIKEIYGVASSKLAPKGVIASITTDRKINSKIYTKHIDIINSTNLDLFNYKIWAKSLKANLYILNYCHMLFFRNKKSINNRVKEFYPDVWLLQSEKVDWYPSKDSFPSELVRRIVMNFTNEGDLVLDPFMGSGKTAHISKDNGRNYLGFDLSSEFVKLANESLANSNALNY